VIFHAEIRKPNPEGRKKAEIRSPKNEPTRIDSDFGPRPSFGFRPSDFGLWGDFCNSLELAYHGEPR
jgi:hypothetical protein